MTQQISQIELQNLREIINSHQTGAAKLQSYAQQCTDQQLKQMLQQSAQSAQQTSQKLISLLQ